MLTAEFLEKYSKEYELLLFQKDHGKLRNTQSFKHDSILDGELFFKLLDKDQQFFLNLPFDKISDVDYAFYYSTNPDCLKERRTHGSHTFEYYYGAVKKQPTNHVPGNNIVCLYCKKVDKLHYSDYNLDFFVGHLFPLLTCERCFYGEELVPEKALSFYRIHLMLYIMENAKCTVLNKNRMDFRTPEKFGIGTSLQFGTFKNMPASFVMRGSEPMFLGIIEHTKSRQTFFKKSTKS